MKASEARRKSSVVKRSQRDAAAKLSAQQNAEHRKWVTEAIPMAYREAQKNIREAIKDGGEGTWIDITDGTVLEAVMERLRKRGYKVSYCHVPYYSDSDGYSEEAHYVLDIDWSGQ